MEVNIHKSIRIDISKSPNKEKKKEPLFLRVEFQLIHIERKREIEYSLLSTHNGNN